MRTNLKINGISANSFSLYFIVFIPASKSFLCVRLSPGALDPFFFGRRARKRERNERFKHSIFIGDNKRRRKSCFLARTMPFHGPCLEWVWEMRMKISWHDIWFWLEGSDGKKFQRQKLRAFLTINVFPGPLRVDGKEEKFDPKGRTTENSTMKSSIHVRKLNLDISI